LFEVFKNRAKLFIIKTRLRRRGKGLKVMNVARVARFFFVHDTKTGKNAPN
jgi:hypothetical protein